MLAEYRQKNQQAWKKTNPQPVTLVILVLQVQRLPVLLLHLQMQALRPLHQQPQLFQMEVHQVVLPPMGQRPLRLLPGRQLTLALRQVQALQRFQLCRPLVPTN
jgi:hypothetical protein